MTTALRLSGAAVRASCDPAVRATGGRRSTWTLLAGCLAGAALAFVALGIWQVERLAWKLDLIARTEARIHAATVLPPTPAEWPRIDAARDEYRVLAATGRFLPVRPARVQALTERGPGFWILAPLRTEAAGTILINRGFVPAEDARPVPDPETGPVTVTGLLRLSESGGGFLRRNDPAGDRWYSRDVAGIAAARGLGPVAPYFIDADGSANRDGAPVGGLTVVTFRNAHLVYALTWFGLAAMAAAGSGLAWRERGRGDAADGDDPRG